MADFHEAFWVVTGTAGPVLLVSSVVALTQTSELQRRYVDVTDEPLKFFRGMKWKVLPRFSPFAFAFVVSTLPIVLDSTIFAISLDALSDERDRLVGLVSVLSKVATTALLLQVVGYVAVLREVRRAERRITKPSGGDSATTGGGAGPTAPAAPPLPAAAAPQDRSSSLARRPRPAPTGRSADALAPPPG